MGPKRDFETRCAPDLIFPAATASKDHEAETFPFAGHQPLECQKLPIEIQAPDIPFLVPPSPSNS
jgi:hypothetical protein